MQVTFSIDYFAQKYTYVAGMEQWASSLQIDFFLLKNFITNALLNCDTQFGKISATCGKVSKTILIISGDNSVDKFGCLWKRASSVFIIVSVMTRFAQRGTVGTVSCRHRNYVSQLSTVPTSIFKRCHRCIIWRNGEGKRERLGNP